MKFNRLIILLTALGAIGWLRAANTTPPRRESFNERYGVLYEHNIFTRDRSHPSISTQSATSRPSVAKLPEESFILTGIVLEDEGFRAYFENPDTLSVTRVAPGDPIARGRISNLDIDAVQYEQGGKKTWVEIGCNLLGKESNSFSSAPSSSSSATTAPSAGAGPTSLPFNPNDPNLTTEQKMKLKRLRELKH